MRETDGNRRGCDGKGSSGSAGQGREAEGTQEALASTADADYTSGSWCATVHSINDSVCSMSCSLACTMVPNFLSPSPASKRSVANLVAMWSCRSGRQPQPAMMSATGMCSRAIRLRTSSMNSPVSALT